jgi:hypothetical protein
MKIKAVLISLVLGSSSVALASPSVTFTAKADASFAFGGPVTRDHRVPSSYQLPGRRASWVALSSPMSLRSGSATIHPELARISQLRLEAKRGMTYVNRVELRFRNGGVQMLRVNRWLTSASTIDLDIKNDRRIIDSIVVVGSSNRFSSHQVFAIGSRFEAPIYQAPPVNQPPVYQPPVYHGFNLGQNLSIVGGAKLLGVGADKGAFNTLRLQGVSGSPYIAMVKIDFADGTSQVQSPLNKTLLAGQSLDIALDGHGARSVERVTLWSTGGAFRYSTGTFNATLL